MNGLSWNNWVVQIDSFFLQHARLIILSQQYQRCKRATSCSKPISNLYFQIHQLRQSASSQWEEKHKVTWQRRINNLLRFCFFAFIPLRRWIYIRFSSLSPAKHQVTLAFLQWTQVSHDILYFLYVAGFVFLRQCYRYRLLVHCWLWPLIWFPIM